jgi:hypothetical protein
MRQRGRKTRELRGLVRVNEGWVAKSLGNPKIRRHRDKDHEYEPEKRDDGEFVLQQAPQRVAPQRTGTLLLGRLCLLCRSVASAGASVAP